MSGMLRLEGVLEQRELIAAVGGVEDDGRAAVAPQHGRTQRTREPDRSSRMAAEAPLSAREGRTRHCYLGRSASLGVRRDGRASASRFANSRNAPGTPAGSCRKKLSPVYTYVPEPTRATRSPPPSGCSPGSCVSRIGRYAESQLRAK